MYLFINSGDKYCIIIVKMLRKPMFSPVTDKFSVNKIIFQIDLIIIS
jgi:hypothetical protein